MNRIPTRAMRANPDIDQLKRQAKELHAAYLSQEADAIAEVHSHHRSPDPTTFALHDAQFVLARSYGFDSWPKLKAYVDGANAARLCEAAERGDHAAVRDLLRRRPELVSSEWPGHGEMTALHIAVLQHDVQMVQLLTDYGADSQKGIWPNRDATSPYTLAADRGFTDLLEIIRAAETKRGAKFPTQPRPPEAMRELQKAVTAGDEDAVVAIFDAHPEFAEICPPDGFTLLHQMAGHVSIKMTEWLLNRGADVNAEAKGGWTALDFAASGAGCRDDESLKRFPALADLLLKHGAKMSPIVAVALGDADFIRAQDPNTLARDLKQEMWRPFAGLLSTAVRHNKPDMLNLLLDLGLDPDERARVGDPESAEFSAANPLYMCVQGGNLTMAQLLLDHGASPNEQVYAAGSPTYVAYTSGNNEMIDLMVKHGGWIDAAAVGYLRQTEVARKMLAGEIDPHLENGEFSGKTLEEQLLWSGASGCCLEIVQMVLGKIDWPRSDPRWFWMLWRPLPGHWDRPDEERTRCREVFSVLLERCDPNLRAENSGQTMLHEVIARDHGEGVGLATLLLDAGARTDIRDRLLNSTPLGWACRWGRVELVKLLLARGADRIEADAEPWSTPRAWAERMKRAEILELLGP